MEILFAVLILALFGILATVSGIDTRDLDTRVQPLTW
jgi:hypothetical protein